MKCVAGHQPNLYPYGGFFAKAMSVDEFVIADTTQYVKKEYHNRNRIKFSDGTAKWITIPVKNAGRFDQLIMNAEIDDSKDWRRQHLRTFELNYRKASHFEEIYAMVKTLLDCEWRLLADFNVAFIAEVFRYLGITAPLARCSEKNICGKSTELILNICRSVGAASYLHGKHSRDYVDFQTLENANIKNLIQSFTPPHYPQLHGGFIENLSIIDMLFNCGKDSTEILKSSNEILDL